MCTYQLPLDEIREWARDMSESTNPRKCDLRTLCNVSTHRLVLRDPAYLLRLEDADESANEVIRRFDSFSRILVSVSNNPTRKALIRMFSQCKYSNNRQNLLHQNPHRDRRLFLGRHQPGEMVHGRARHRHNSHEHCDAAADVQNLLPLRFKKV